MGFPGDSVVKNPSSMQEMQETLVWSLGQETPMEEGMATHSSILTWRIPWTEEPGRLQFIGLRRMRHDWSNSACIHAIYTQLTIEQLRFELYGFTCTWIFFKVNSVLQYNTIWGWLNSQMQNYEHKGWLKLYADF